jgi:hypothetical protein
MKRLAAVLVFGAVAIAPARAEWMVYGIGVSKCSEIYKMSEIQIGSWLGGYITGANHLASISLQGASIDMTGSLDLDVVMGYVKAYCYRNPTHTVGTAAGEVVGTMWGWQNSPTASRPAPKAPPAAPPRALPGVRYQ